MIELLHQIEQIDTQIFLFFNGFHNVYWDYFMMIFSDRFVWPVLCQFYLCTAEEFSCQGCDEHYSCHHSDYLVFRPDCIRNSKAIGSKNASQQS